MPPRIYNAQELAVCVNEKLDSGNKLYHEALAAQFGVTKSLVQRVVYVMRKARNYDQPSELREYAERLAAGVISGEITPNTAEKKFLTFRAQYLGDKPRKVLEPKKPKEMIKGPKKPIKGPKKPIKVVHRAPQSAEEQRKVILNFIATLSGILTAIESSLWPLSDELSSEELANWHEGFMKLKRRLYRQTGNLRRTYEKKVRS